MIRCLIPDLPALPDLLPYLECIERNRWYTNFGPLLLQYESRLAEITGGYCVTLASGTAALELALAALALPAGGRVLLPAFTFPATLLAVLRNGLQPVFADVEARSWTLTPAIARMALRWHPYTLVLPVACLGLPLPAAAWDAFTQETGVPVLMDAAAALGSQRIGETSHAAFSLHATKPLGIGEGGVFATPDAELAERVRCMANFGFSQGKVVCQGATNAKLSEYAAAVGLAQLARWPALRQRRCAVWAAYRAALAEVAHAAWQPFDAHTPPAVLSVALGLEAETMAGRLARAGVETRRWYAPPLHRHPAFSGIERAGPDEDLPVTEHLYRYCLGLPFHAFLSHEDVAAVVENLKITEGQ